MFDESMSRKIKEHLDIHLTFSMTALADDTFFSALPTDETSDYSPPPPPQLDEQPEPLSLPPLLDAPASPL